MRLQLLVETFSHQRVQLSFQPRAFLWITEHDEAECRTVQAFTELALYFYSLALQHRTSRRSARSQSFMGVEICIQNGNALLF